MTALLDAVGGSIDGIEKQYGEALKNDEMSIVMVIITDGYENASRYFTYHMVAKKIAISMKLENGHLVIWELILTRFIPLK